MRIAQLRLLRLLPALFAVLWLLSLAAAVPAISAEEEAAEADDPAVFEPTVGEREMKYIDMALAAMNMTREDLSFKKDYRDDPYRFKIANELLDKPLDCPTYADDMQVRVAQSYKSRDKLIEYIGESMDLTVPRVAVSTPGYRLKRAFEDIFGSDACCPEGLEDELPGEVAYSLTAILYGMKDARDLLRKAFADLNEDEILWLKADAISLMTEDQAVSEGFISDEQKKELAEKYKDAPPTDFFDVCMKVKKEYLIAASAVLLGRCDVAVKTLKRYCAENAEKLPDLIKGSDFETPYGRIVIGGTGRDRFEGAPPAVLIDFGGDDEYMLAPGRAVGFVDGETPTAVAIDLAGDDYYNSKKLFSNGAGFMGIGVAYDCTGNDIYKSGSLSQAAGLLGVGVLVEEDGNDVYYGGTGVQGAAIFGAGVLVDEKGRDHYNADLFAQAFSRTMGFGMLVDVEGTDLYFAGGEYSHYPLLPEQFQSLSQGFTIGYRPFASAGLAALLDFDGNDRYITDVYGQGASYWFGVGILIDNDGSDDYVVYQYGMGGGIHLTTGILIDRGDDKDRYSNQHGVGMGGAHDWSVAWLVDKGGDDYYQGCGITQGGVNANGVAFFIDCGGNDSYAATYPGSSQGGSFASRDYGGIGVFLDLGGKDRYTQGGEDDSIWVRTTWGCGIDVDSEPE